MANNNLGLNGINPLSYMGVNAYSPSNFVLNKRAPDDTDFKNMPLGTLWLNNASEEPTKADIYMFLSGIS